MIWGLALEPGLEYTTTSPEEVHLSLAAIESRTDFGKAGSYSQLILKTDGTEQLLCTLVHGTIFQQCLDLKLMAGEKVTFTVYGSFGVFITGYSYRSPLEPSNEVSTSPKEASNNENENSVTYKEPQGSLPQIKQEPQEDRIRTTNGRKTSSAARQYRDEDEMETDATEEGQVGDSLQYQIEERPAIPQPTRVTTIPTPILSPKTAASGGNPTHVTNDKISRELESTPGKSNGGDGPSRTRAESSQDAAGSSTLNREVLSALSLHEKPKTISGAATAEPRQMVAGPSSQESTDIVPSVDQRSNHREATVVSAAGPSPSFKQKPPDDRFTCPLCSEVFPGKDALLAHEQKHAEDGEMFSCRYCHMVFVQKGNRNIHERIHSAMRHNIRTAFKAQAAAESREVKQPQPTLDEVLQESKAEVTEAPPVVPIPSSAPQQSTYVNKAPTKETPVRSRPYPTYSGLGLRAHQGEEEKNYRCQFCEKPFKRNYDRNRHERIHTGQKPYECSYCELAFSRREHCKKHEFTHLKTPGGLPSEGEDV